MLLQIVDHLDDRTVECLSVRHARKAVYVAHEKLRHVVLKLGHGHARIRARRGMRMAQRHIARIGVRRSARADVVRNGEQLLVRREGRVRQHAPRQHVIFEIRREQLPVNGAVHIEHRDAPLDRNEVLRGLVRHRVDVRDQRIERRCNIVPGREHLLGVVLLRGLLRLAGKRAEQQCKRQKQRDPSFLHETLLLKNRLI